MNPLVTLTFGIIVSGRPSNKPPVIVTPADRSYLQGERVQDLVLTVNDLGDNGRMSVVGLPPGLFHSFDEVLGTVAADAEVKDYPVTVTVRDNRSGRPDAPSVTGASVTSVRVSWTPPVNTGSPITDYDVQYRKQGSHRHDDHDHDKRPGVRDHLYEVQVRANNGAGSGSWSASGRGRSKGRANRPPVTVGNILPQMLLVDTSRTIDSTPFFDDPDGDPLTYVVVGVGDPHGACAQQDFRMVVVHWAILLPRTLEMREGDSKTYTMKLELMPTGEVTVRVTDREGAARHRVAKHWLVRFGRTVANNALNLIGERFDASPSSAAVQITIADRGLGLDGVRSPVGIAGFKGREGDLSLDGDVLSGHIGIDYAWEHLLTGLAVSRNEGEGGLPGSRQRRGRGRVGRQDGRRMETGGRLRFSDPSLGLTVEGSGRVLLMHRERGYDEWGVGGVLRLSPGAAGRGLSIQLAPSYGQASRGVDRLWTGNAESLAPRSANDNDRAARLDAEIGYGLGALGGHGLVTPYVGLTLTDGDSRSWRLGSRLAVGPGISLSLEVERRESETDSPEQVALLSGRLNR